jgi:hypothetical protein
VVIIKRLELNDGAGRGGRTPKGRSPADFESAASASSAIPALRGMVDFTDYFTFYVLMVHDGECETVQVNAKVFMDFHRSLPLAHIVLCESSSGDDVNRAER